ncbi:hypothetical protein [Kibdelosporangium phytohabitans]|uniref:Uncharacterized protein n=1 Tax=Kibdelosporangium phytohabitans TaxID=860235 RepID=A0A0N9HUS9_9PSEU|nr:hypothetical protein [Kibdelosporangium phytohabitans]ALG05661.1 hypothetical protein AOZ06_00815 [Kibdelosporangium phytohabitans]MBE1466359.1 hypothetical protein [Kibdelosporangium phytohabitans]
MMALVLTWIGAVVGVTLVLLMALGPVIVELDGWLAQRRRDRHRKVVAQKLAMKKAAATVAARPVFH